MRLEDAVALPVVLREERHLPVLLDASGGFARGHRALALEDDALVDDETRREDVPEDPARRPDLETLAGRDVPRHLAVNDDRRAVDLCVHHRGLADREA